MILKRKTRGPIDRQFKALMLMAVPIIIIGVIVDKLLKVYVTSHLKDLPAKNIIPGILNLTYVENTGAAFGILKGHRYLFVGITIIVLVFTLYHLFKGNIYGTFGLGAVSLCISGTIGNLIDRVADGFVVDMFETVFVEFPVFNMADALLNIGGVMLAIYILWFHERLKEERRNILSLKNVNVLHVCKFDNFVSVVDLREGRDNFKIAVFPKPDMKAQTEED